MKGSVTWELAIYLNLSQEVIFNIKSKQSEKVNCFGFFAVALPQLVCSLMLTKTLFFLNDDQYWSNSFPLKQDFSLKKKKTKLNYYIILGFM